MSDEWNQEEWAAKQQRFEARYLPRVSLKSVKHAAYLSEETNAYTATVYWDGKRIGTAKNDGHGGSTFVRPYSAKGGDDLRQVEKMLADDPDHNFDSLGGLCDVALEEYLQTRDHKKWVKAGKIVWQDGDCSSGQYHVVKWPPIAKLWPTTKEHFLVEAKKKGWISDPATVTFVNDTVIGA